LIGYQITILRRNDDQGGRLRDSMNSRAPRVDIVWMGVWRCWKREGCGTWTLLARYRPCWRNELTKDLVLSPPLHAWERHVRFWLVDLAQKRYANCISGICLVFKMERSISLNCGEYLCRWVPLGFVEGTLKVPAMTG
jgi:hypothetical protein